VKALPTSRLTDTEEAVVRAVDSHREDLVQLVSELVQIPSLPGDEAVVAQHLHRRAREMGFAAEMLELRDRDVAAPGRPGVLAIVGGKEGGYSLMFNGHLDTEPVSPTYAGSGEDPFSGRVEGGRIYGIGTMNMKSAVAAYFYAVRSLLDTGYEPHGDIVIAAVPAELNGGAGTRYFMESGVQADMCINGEASELRLITASTGIVNVRLVLTGQPTHMAFPDKGRSVVDDLRFLLDRLAGLEITYDRGRYGGKLEPRLNLGYINGGYEYRAGLFLDRCEVVINVRGPRGVTPGTVKADVSRFVERLATERPGIELAFSVLNPIPRFMPPFHVNPDEYVVQAVARAHREVTGREAEYATTYAGVDAGTLQYWWDIPSVVYGPAGASGSFTPPETVEIEELMIAARVYALAALDVTSQPRGKLEGRLNLPV
jgi:acetylornithine deacetylase